MEENRFNGIAGRIVQGKGIIDGKTRQYKYFLPKEIPNLLLPNSTIKLLCNANLCIGELKGLAKDITKTTLDLFIKAYKRREAWVSTKIEGTNVSLTDVFLSEAGSAETRDKNLREISNHIRAVDNALKRVASGRDIDRHLINELHYFLLKGVRGSNRLVGSYRQVQNWINGKNWQSADFIPPHYDEVDDSMEYLFSYMRREDDISRLMKIGLMHYFFETIHPYEDGNGRVGRALITLYMVKQGIMEQPILYVSTFFEKNRRAYYDILTKVRENGDYVAWIEFFLNGVCQTSIETSKKIKILIELRENYTKKLSAINAKSLSFTLLDLFFENPYWSIPSIRRLALKKNYPLIKRGINNLMEIGLVTQHTLRKRNKVYVAREISNVFEND